MSVGPVSGRPHRPFNGVKVFFATMVADRDQLGEKVTAWMKAHPQCTPVDIIVAQSSDRAFHCVSITLFYLDETKRRTP